MTKAQFTQYIAAILTTALDTEPGPFPESMAYLAMGSDINAWNTVKSALATAGLATFAGHSLALTDKGRELARQCNAALAAR